MIISISGPSGSGKSTIARKLSDQLGWPRYYMGGLRREAARQRGLTLAEYNQLGETDPSTDQEVDVYQAQLAREQDNFIIEGRTSWHFIPQSLKIYIDVDEKEGAERVWRDLKTKAQERNEDLAINSPEEVLESTRQRIQSDRRRYQKYYQINVYDRSNYDLVFDTTGKGPEQAFTEVWQAIRSYLHK